MTASDWNERKGPFGFSARDSTLLLADLAAEERRAEMHAKINRDVAITIGLPDGSSWADLGEKVAAVMDQIAEAQIREQETANRAEAAEADVKLLSDAARENEDMIEKAKASVALLREARDTLAFYAADATYKAPSWGEDTELSDIPVIDDHGEKARVLITRIEEALK